LKSSWELWGRKVSRKGSRSGTIPLDSLGTLRTAPDPGKESFNAGGPRPPHWSSTTTEAALGRLRINYSPGLSVGPHSWNSRPCGSCRNHSELSFLGPTAPFVPPPRAGLPMTSELTGDIAWIEGDRLAVPCTFVIPGGTGALFLKALFCLCLHSNGPFRTHRRGISDSDWSP
jgi:hypothetical protein